MRQRVYLGLVLFGIVVASILLVNKWRARTGAPATKPISGNLSSEDGPVSSSSPHIDTALERKISDWEANQPGDYGVMVREVSSPYRTASYKADSVFIAASTFKLFLVEAVLSAVEKGQLTLSTPVVGNMDIAACIDSLLIQSSDECAWPMGRLLGWSQVQSAIEQQGFAATKINNYDDDGQFVGSKVTSASDQAEFMWRLQSGKLLNADHTELVLSRLKQQKWRERIPAGLPAGAVSAGKPGWLDSIENDTAIVYGSKSTYVLSILSDGSTPANLASLSRLIYDHLNQ